MIFTEETALYQHFLPILLKEAKESQEEIHIPHMPPFEDDGAHCEDDID